MKKYLLLAASLLGLAHVGHAQLLPATAAATPAPTVVLPLKIKHRGTAYLNWSYNRDWYTKSNIRFKNDKSDDYDFTFYDAKAHDHPSMSDFWKLDNLTVPQYDLTVGYMLGDKHDLGIEVSWNHLKYVVDDYQTMRVAGEIPGLQV